jgi:hypothetical protein
MNDDDVEPTEVEGDAVPHGLGVESPDLVAREAAECVDVVQHGVGMPTPVIAKQQNPGLAHLVIRGPRIGV